MREKAKRVAVLAMVTVLLGGCAAMQREEAKSMEATLSAAGFQMKPADTPERVAHLNSMRPLKIVPHLKDGRLLYVYADPKSCKCLFVGDEQAYQRYQALAIREKLTQEQMMAAQMNEDAAMNWGLWGPFWW